MTSEDPNGRLEEAPPLRADSAVPKLATVRDPMTSLLRISTKDKSQFHSNFMVNYIPPAADLQHNSARPPA